MAQTSRDRRAGLIPQAVTPRTATARRSGTHDPTGRGGAGAGEPPRLGAAWPTGLGAGDSQPPPRRAGVRGQGSPRILRLRACARVSVSVICVNASVDWTFGVSVLEIPTRFYCTAC